MRTENVFFCLKLKEQGISKVTCRCLSYGCPTGCTIFLCLPMGGKRELMKSHLGSNPEDLPLEAQVGERFTYLSKRARTHSLLLYHDAFFNLMLLKFENPVHIFSLKSLGEGRGTLNMPGNQ